MMPAATAAFRDSAPPRMGSLTRASAVETGGVKDTDYMVRACKAFYESALKITDDGAIMLE